MSVALRERTLIFRSMLGQPNRELHHVRVAAIQWPRIGMRPSRKEYL